jgi:hypothetical protein
MPWLCGGTAGANLIFSRETSVPSVPLWLLMIAIASLPKTENCLFSGIFSKIG